MTLRPWQLGFATVAFVCLGFLAILIRNPQLRPVRPASGDGPEPVELRADHLPGMAPAIQRLLVHPTRDDWLIALGAHRASFVSRDRGRSWEALLLSEPWPGRDLRVPDPAPAWDPRGNLVALRSGAVYVSENGGLTFDRHHVGPGLHQLHVYDDGTLRVGRTRIAGGGELTLRTVRGERDELLPELTPATARSTPAKPEFAPLSTEGGVWTLDRGIPRFRAAGTRTAEPRSRGLDHPVPVQLIQDEDHPAWVAFVDTVGQLWSSTDFGRAWARQSVRDVGSAVYLAPSARPTWVVRQPDLQFALVQNGTPMESLGPTLPELQRLVVPPYVPRSRLSSHHRDMLLTLLRNPELEAAGRTEEGSIWVQLDGVDAIRDRWTVRSDGTWRSDTRPDRVRRIAAWGESPRRRCTPTVSSGVAFVRDHPLERDAEELGDAIHVGFAGDTAMYAVHEHGAVLRDVAEDCTVAEPRRRAWTWFGTSPPLRQVRSHYVDGRQPRVDLLGVGEHGVWRVELPLTASAESPHRSL